MAVCDRAGGSWGPARLQKTWIAAWWRDKSSSSLENWVGNLGQLWLCRSRREGLKDYAKAVYLDSKANQPASSKYSYHAFVCDLGASLKSLKF